MLLVLYFALLVSSHSVSCFHFPSTNQLSSSPHAVSIRQHRARGEVTPPNPQHAKTCSLSYSSSKDDDERPDSASLSWLFALVLPLQLTYVSNQWSRSSVYYLVNFSDDALPFYSMNADIGFTQAQYGLLASVAFSVLFAFASLGAGLAADRFNRKQLTIASMLGWGTATLGTAFSSSYDAVLFWRVTVYCPGVNIFRHSASVFTTANLCFVFCWAFRLE